MLQVNLDFTAAASAIFIGFHVCIKFEEGIFVHLRSDIEHEAEFGLQVLADRLEEPFVRVDLTVVAVLDSEHNVHSATFEDILIKSQIPRRHLPHMQNVLRDLIFRHGFLHDVL